MALSDYVLCSCCECKYVYDGYDHITDSLDDKYGENQWEAYCPKCLKDLKASRDELLELLEIAISALEDAAESAYVEYGIIDMAHKAIAKVKGEKNE